MIIPTEKKKTRWNRILYSFVGKFANPMEYQNLKKMYKHQPETKTEAKESSLLWNFAIQTNRKIKSNRPDIVIKDYKRKTC